MAQTIKLDTSQRVDIICKKGDTFDLSLTLKDNSATPASIVADGDTFKMEVRTTDDGGDAYSDSDASIILSTLDGSSDSKHISVRDSGGAILTNSDAGRVPTDGIVRFFVTAANMASAPAGLYVYDIEMTDSDSTPADKVTTLIYGTFKINEDVSV
jgi:hypothetical protein|tara:strand:- start:4173 stop:4640 length:468 start_codon:yes stop_codon:yes gene_type:complete